MHVHALVHNHCTTVYYSLLKSTTDCSLLQYCCSRSTTSALYIDSGARVPFSHTATVLHSSRQIRRPAASYGARSTTYFKPRAARARGCGQQLHHRVHESCTYIRAYVDLRVVVRTCQAAISSNSAPRRHGRLGDMYVQCTMCTRYIVQYRYLSSRVT